MDSKTELQEALARSGRSVQYEVLDVDGPPHERRFVCAALIDGEQLGTGSGSTKKARLLLKSAPKLAAYVPVDICGEMIESEAAGLRRDRPQLPVLPVVADICQPFALPDIARNAPARVGTSFAVPKIIE